MKARLIAFYLPQFHPIPENDAWWGKGFTEWHNVAKARPLFRGHYQPHLPADLGFYDLRVPESRIAQASLAKEHGIEGFCYWHYWFHGKRLLGRPLNEVLSSSLPDIPFCLAWANEPWSRRWLGEPKDILQAQSYSPEDDREHSRWLVKVFTDKRYMHVKGRPIFLIYRPLDLPDPRKTVDIFREECRKSRISDPHLVGIDAHCVGVNFRKFGFDQTLNFEPQLSVLSGAFKEEWSLLRLIRNLRYGIFDGKLKIYDYENARQLMRDIKNPSKDAYPCIFVGWDNTPRLGNKAIIICNSSAEKFEKGLTEIVKAISDKPYEDRLVFINAWNEWAEGNYLEPDLKNGQNYLAAVARTNQASASELRCVD